MNFIETVQHFEKFFREMGFSLTELKDLGMHKAAKFSKEMYDLDFYFDRGGIELVVVKNGIIIRDVVSLANYLNSESDKYSYPSLRGVDEHQKIRKLSQVFFDEYQLIDQFLSVAKPEDISDFEENQKFEAALFWKNRFQEKGKQVPDSLKSILESKK